MSENQKPKSLRIIIFAIGSAGDVYPFIAIGKNLRARGHEVFIAASPFFEEIITAHDIGFRPMGTIEDFERVKNDPDLWSPIRSLPAVMRLAADPSHELIWEIARELHHPGQTVILASSLAFGARSAGEILDIPVASAHLAPSLFVTLYTQPKLAGMLVGDRAPKFLKSLQWWVGGKMIDHYGLPALNRFRKKHSLPPAKNLLASWWHAPAAVFALFPKWFAPAQPDWPQQTCQTGFAMFDGEGEKPWPDGLAKFLEDGDPPLIFTPGSAMAQGESFFREAAKAVETLGCRALFITRFPESLPGNLPSQIRHFDYLPFSEILPLASAIVYHGGIGTCARALQAGVPQLIQAMAHDQLDNLARVERLGVGLGLSPRRFKEKNIVRALRKLLENPKYKDRAKEVAKNFQRDEWMEETCDGIEGLA